MTVEHVARVAVALEIVWTTFSKGIFRIGYSTLDGGDTLGASFADPRWAGEFSDASGRLRRAAWKRGASDNLTAIDASTMTAEVDDADGLYNAENVASPLYGLLEDRMHPIRLRSTYPFDAGIFSGWIRSITPVLGKRKGTVSFDCVDLFYWLDDAHPVIPDVGHETTGQAIGRILDAIGWLDPSGRALGRGDDLPGFSSDGSTSALELVKGLLAAERGRFWIDGNGVARYVDRHGRLNLSSVATIADEMTALSPGVAVDRVANMIDVTDAAGTTVSVEHHESRLRFGDKSLGSIATPYLFPGLAEGLGTYVLSTTATPRPPLRDLQIDSRTEELRDQILLRELGEVVTVEEAKIGTAGDFLIESISGQVDRSNGRLEASYVLSKPEVNAAALYLGTGLLGVGELVY